MTGSNVPQLLKKFSEAASGKIVPRWNRNVARWDAEGNNRNVLSMQICSIF